MLLDRDYGFVVSAVQYDDKFHEHRPTVLQYIVQSPMNLQVPCVSEMIFKNDFQNFFRKTQEQFFEKQGSFETRSHLGSEFGEGVRLSSTTRTRNRSQTLNKSGRKALEATYHAR